MHRTGSASLHLPRRWKIWVSPTSINSNELPRRTVSCYRPHLLAPTASDLEKYGRKDTILAGFHTDLNFLTIHGRSRYPGLNIWARNTGKRLPVKIPAGNYLLVQAGKQLEHLTGGLIKAGYHEVVVNDQTLKVRLLRSFKFVTIRCASETRSSKNAKLKTLNALLFEYPRLSSGIFLRISTSAQYHPLPNERKLLEPLILHLADMPRTSRNTSP